MKITEQDINEAKIQARAEGAAQGMAKGMARGKAEERTGILRKPVDAGFSKSDLLKALGIDENDDVNNFHPPLKA